jgi:anti-sigma factor RsiW
MTCQELVEVVTDYLDGALPESDRARFELHLGECSYCVTYIEQMRTTVSVLGRLDQRSIDPVALDRLLEEFRGWKRRRSD